MEEEIWQDELTQLYRADELLMLDEESWINNEKSKQAVELAESIANNMTEIEVARAKKECMTQLEKEE